MEQLFYNRTRFHKAWGTEEKQLKRRNILVSITLKDRQGQEYQWTPRYSDLSRLCSFLIALHGRRELINKLFGDSDKRTLEELEEEFLIEISDI